MSRATFTPQAARDIDDISEYIAIHNLNAAIKFCYAVDDASNKLAEMPGLGRLRAFSASESILIRTWPIKHFRNYLIVYRPASYGVEILRILHAARDIDVIFADVDQH